jgi:hypothetical protein
MANAVGAVSATEDTDNGAKEDIKVLADAVVHLYLRRLDLVVRGHESGGVAATFALEEENCLGSRGIRRVGAQSNGQGTTIYQQNY